MLVYAFMPNLCDHLSHLRLFRQASLVDLTSRNSTTLDLQARNCVVQIC